MERLQKFLAKAGVASRRKSEELISRGKVIVNGKVITQMGTKIDPDSDKIIVEGQLIRQAEKKVYYMLYKPCGYVTTLKDPQGRKKVIDLLKEIPYRIYPVGRLDYNTSGLLILTNDGELTNALIHPRHEVEKTYKAMVKGICSKETIVKLQKGIKLSDGPTAPAKVKLIKYYKENTLLELIIHEGRNRQIRRMCKTVGHPVRQLERVKFGHLNLIGLAPGEYRQLTPSEVSNLKAEALV